MIEEEDKHATKMDAPFDVEAIQKVRNSLVDALVIDRLTLRVSALEKSVAKLGEAK